MNDFFWGWMLGLWKGPLAESFQASSFGLHDSYVDPQASEFLDKRQVDMLIDESDLFHCKSCSCTPSSLQKPHKSILFGTADFGVKIWWPSNIGYVLLPLYRSVPVLISEFPRKSQARLQQILEFRHLLAREAPSHNEPSPLPTQSGHFLMRSHSEMNPVKHAKLILILGCPALRAKLFQHEITIRALYVSIRNSINLAMDLISACCEDLYDAFVLAHFTWIPRWIWWNPHFTSIRHLS